MLARSRDAAVWPPLYVPTVRPSRSLMPSASATSEPRAFARAAPTPQSRACTSRFRCPVNERSTVASWKTTLLMRRAPRGSAATSNPSSSAVPLVGARVVVSMPIVVDLPAPFGPSRPNTSPAPTRKSMPFTASTPPWYVFLSARTSIAGRFAVMCMCASLESVGCGRVAACHIRVGSFVTAMTGLERRM